MPDQSDPTYCTWIKMRVRCNNPKDANFKYYGERGIKVCPRWDVYANFLVDMGPRPSKEHTIDRIDPNGNYGPENCRWATVAEQNRNKRTVRKFRVGGRDLIARELAEILNIDRSYVRKLMRGGLQVHELYAKFNFNPAQSPE